MRRRWSVQHIVDRCDKVKQQLDRPALTTDVIVGFPGETDREFRGNAGDLPTYRLFQDSHVSVQRPPGNTSGRHAGPGSARGETGTGRRLAELETECRRDFSRSLVGTQVRMMVENVDDQSGLSGTTGRYLPARVSLNATPAASLRGQLVEFEVAEVCNEMLYGSLSSSDPSRQVQGSPSG